jgi:hypothetical protein
MRFNQYTKGTVRGVRIPSVSVTKMERVALEDAARTHRITMSQIIRCGLVLMGVLDTSSLDDLPEAIAERVSSGKGLAPLRRVQS